MTTKFDLYEEVTNRIVEALESGVVPWHKPWTTQIPTNFKTKKPYRGINPILLSLSGFASPYWLTYKQAKELGGQVRKGEHGSLVVFFKHYLVDTDEKGDDGKPVKESRFVLRHYTVFNLEQIDGIEVPTVTTDDAPERDADGEAVVAGFENKPEIRNGSAAYYQPHTDIVTVPPIESFESSDGYYATLFHELAHSTGHESRLARFKGDPDQFRFGSKHYAEEELVAEIAASFLGAEAGLLDPVRPADLENHAAYIASWLRALEDDKRLVVYAAARAQKAADHILGKHAAEDTVEQAA